MSEVTYGDELVVSTQKSNPKQTSSDQGSHQTQATSEEAQKQVPAASDKLESSPMCSKVPFTEDNESPEALKQQ